MKKADFFKNPFELETPFGKYRVEKMVYEKPLFDSWVSDNLTFIHSLNTLELVVERREFFVPERSAIKIHPGVEVGLTMDSSAEFYVVTVLTPECEILSNIKTLYPDFYNSLSKMNSSILSAIEKQDPDYVVHGEMNAD